MIHKKIITGKLQLFLLLSFIVTSCSTPKYYYFDRYSIQTIPSTGDLTSTPIASKLAPEEINAEGPTLKRAESEEDLLPAEAISLPQQTDFLRKNVVKSLSADTIKARHSKKQKNKHTESAAKEDEKNNKFAVAGLTLSVSAPIIMFLVFIQTGSGIVLALALPLYLLALVLNVLGLKSKKRKLAKIGLWILGIIGGLALLLIIYFSSMPDFGMGEMNLI